MMNLTARPKVIKVSYPLARDMIVSVLRKTGCVASFTHEEMARMICEKLGFKGKRDKND